MLKGDTVIIRLARNLSQTEEQEHIRDLLRRMTKIVLEERTKVLVNPFRGILQGENACTVRLPTRKTYRYALVAGEKTRASLRQNKWRISVGPKTHRDALHRFLWKTLAHAERRRVTELVESINRQTLRVRIRGVRLQFASTQWGSCSSQGIIMVNAALLLLPPRFLKYIIVHELAHRLRADHSPAFWKIVEQAMPGFDAVRKELMEYRLPTS